MVPAFQQSSSVFERSHRINSAIAFGAIAMFVLLAAPVLTMPFGGASRALDSHATLLSLFLLDIAMILFTWRRAAELKRSIDQQAQSEDLYHGLAYLDDTCGLYNRRYLLDQISQYEAEGRQLTLLLIDLDHFKKVNDLYGHMEGDNLLRNIAQRIRQVAPPGACCARLGGDEFAVLLCGSEAEMGRATQLAEGLLAAINQPISLRTTLASVGASLGISAHTGEGPGPSEVMRHSDIAMYDAKRRGRNCYSWFEPEMERVLNERSRLEAEMRQSLSNGNFVPFFQPTFDVQSGEANGFEVLARWLHPARGIVEPDEFISIAEATGIISELSLAVMRSALHLSKGWPNHLTISVNISPVQFKDPLLAQRIVQLLTETGFPPSRLELEITESALLNNPELALSTVESLKNYGIRVALDDFGTGYASLSQLRMLPFDRIKIDRSFISSLIEDDQSNAIVHAIATLGKSLNLPITAEGIESEEIYARLKSLGCSDAQGWLFGKAMSAEDTAKTFLPPGSIENRHLKTAG